MAEEMLPSAESKAPSTLHESLEHPYTFVDEDPRYMILQAQDGTEFDVTRTVGRTILALEVGEENGKNRKQISRHLYSKGPNKRAVVSPGRLKALVREARKATTGLGPPIITTQRKRSSDSTIYYYEIPLQDQYLNDWEGWDNDDSLTRIRYDTRTSDLTILHNGVRQSARLGGMAWASPLIVEAFLRHPYEPLSWRSLTNMVSADHNKFIGIRSISAFKPFMEKRFGDTFAALIESELDGDKPNVKLYTLLADRVEIIEKDGSKHVYFESFEDTAEEVVATNDASCAATALLMTHENIRRYLPSLLRAKCPRPSDLIELSEKTAPSPDRNVGQFAEDKIIGSLERIKTFFDQPDAEARLRNWSPDDARLKSLIGFLLAFDRLQFTFSSLNQKFRGIDLLTEMLRKDDRRETSRSRY